MNLLERRLPCVAFRIGDHRARQRQIRSVRTGARQECLVGKEDVRILFLSGVSEILLDFKGLRRNGRQVELHVQVGSMRAALHVEHRHGVSCVIIKSRSPAVCTGRSIIGHLEVLADLRRIPGIAVREDARCLELVKDSGRLSGRISDRTGLEIDPAGLGTVDTAHIQDTHAVDINPQIVISGELVDDRVSEFVEAVFGAEEIGFQLHAEVVVNLRFFGAVGIPCDIDILHVARIRCGNAGIVMGVAHRVLQRVVREEVAIGKICRIGCSELTVYFKPVVGFVEPCVVLTSVVAVISGLGIDAREEQVGRCALLICRIKELVQLCVIRKNTVYEISLNAGRGVQVCTHDAGHHGTAREVVHRDPDFVAADRIHDVQLCLGILILRHSGRKAERSGIRARRLRNDLTVLIDIVNAEITALVPGLDSGDRSTVIAACEMYAAVLGRNDTVHGRCQVFARSRVVELVITGRILALQVIDIDHQLPVKLRRRPVVVRAGGHVNLIAGFCHAHQLAVSVQCIQFRLACRFIDHTLVQNNLIDFVRVACRSLLSIHFINSVKIGDRSHVRGRKGICGLRQIDLLRIAEIVVGAEAVRDVVALQVRSHTAVVKPDPAAVLHGHRDLLGFACGVGQDDRSFFRRRNRQILLTAVYRCRNIVDAILRINRFKSPFRLTAVGEDHLLPVNGNYLYLQRGTPVREFRVVLRLNGAVLIFYEYSQGIRLAGKIRHRISGLSVLIHKHISRKALGSEADRVRALVVRRDHIITVFGEVYDADGLVRLHPDELRGDVDRRRRLHFLAGAHD